jgi:hypothetical protein
MTRRFLAVIAACIMCLAGGGVAYAAISGGPPVTTPTPVTGAYYSGPVHECVSTADESTAYFEENSGRQGNCAPGYIQLAVNELTGGFTLELGGATWDCTADTAQAQTALSCTDPSKG